MPQRTPMAAPVYSLPEALTQFGHYTGYKKLDVMKMHGKALTGIFQNPETNERYAVTLKREWYKSFSYHFPEVPDKGLGQITSLKLLEWCERGGVPNLVAVVQIEDENEVIIGVRGYVCDVTEFLRYYHKYDTDMGKISAYHPRLVGEVACPIRMWKRLYPQ